MNERMKGQISSLKNSGRNIARIALLNSFIKKLIRLEFEPTTFSRLKGCGFFGTTQNANVYRFTFNLHGFKIMMIESFP